MPGANIKICINTQEQQDIMESPIFETFEQLKQIDHKY
jgi:hypothetical protein